MTLRDPFNPKDGEFATNIRRNLNIDDTELRELMQKLGWLPDLPALADENNVILVGHRRMKIANELGIKPIIKTIKFGRGDEADAKRVSIALASNIGHAPFTKEDRKHIAEYLYGGREWTMDRIAEALNVSQRTISEDLRGLEATSKPSRPKGGRPKGSSKHSDEEGFEVASKRPQPKSSGKRQPQAPKRHYKEEEIVARADQGLSFADIATETGVGKRQVRHIVERERIRREAQAETIDPSTLSMTAQQKIEAAIRQAKHKLELEFEQRIRERARALLDEFWLPDHKKKLADADAVLKARRGIMPRAMYNQILHCLHPDSRNSITEKRLNDAFIAFEKFEVQLVSEKELPTPTLDFPRTYEEAMAHKRKVSEKRKAQRATSRAKTKVSTR